MANGYQLKKKFEQITSEIDRFNAAWSQHCVSSDVFCIDLLTEKVSKREIQVRPLDGLAAVNTAITGLSKLRFDVDNQQDPSTVYRLPGLIVTSKDFSGDIAKINQLKDEFHELYRACAETNYLRREIRKEFLPLVSMLQTTRHIHHVDYPLSKAAFTWAGHTQKTRRIKPSEAEKMVANSLEWWPENYTRERWEEIVNGQLDLLKYKTAHEGASVIERRVIAPHPRVTLHDAREKYPVVEGGTKKYYKEIVHANLPVFYSLECSREMPVLKGLKAFSAKEKRKKRSDTLAAEKQVTPFIGPLNLYFVSP